MGSFPEQQIVISTPPHHPQGVTHHNVGFSLLLLIKFSTGWEVWRGDRGACLA